MCLVVCRRCVPAEEGVFVQMQIYRMAGISIVYDFIVGIKERVVLDTVIILYRLHRNVKSSEFRRTVLIIVGIGIVVDAYHLIIQLALNILAVVYLDDIPRIFGLDSQGNIF